MPDLPIPQTGHDIVTPRAMSIWRDGGESAYRRLVVEGPTPAQAHRLLNGVAAEDLVSKPIKHRDDALAALGGLWLWLDGLDECHRIVQDIASPTGSFWHAIMHRREGDFSNSKYWYARCANHHVIKMLGAIASSLAAEQSADPLVAGALAGGWDPNGFVDWVEQVNETPTDPRHELAIRLQWAEWEALFGYCVRAAIDTDRAGLDDWDWRVTAPK